MKVQLESTTLTFDLNASGRKMRVRLWQGNTEKGLPVFALIPRLVVDMGDGGTADYFPDAMQTFKVEWAGNHIAARPWLREGWEKEVEALWVTEGDPND